MRRIAVVGIDGSGKSTVVRRCQEIAREAADDLLVMTCPAYHETPDAPLADLSRALDALSRLADGAGSFELKAAAMYLQMTLYGPVERCLADAFHPRFLVSEHHAIVDTLAYAPLYVQAVRRAPDPAVVEPVLRERLNGAYAAVRRWHALENARLDLDVSFWDLAPHVRDLLSRPLHVVVDELRRRYRCELPDVVLFLDVPVATARERLAARSGVGAELHESPAALEALSRSTRHVLDALSRAYPSVEVRTVDSTTGVDETVRQVLDYAGAAGR